MLKYAKTLNLSSSLLIGASALAMLATAGAAYAQDNESIETVTVTGFRASLEKALDMKRTALDASDSIMAEDIAKFPDMNVSESLQRIPGVAITREAGEGRQISVRGLGAEFTRVRINGIEAMATVSGPDASTSGSLNRGRGFDFNVFASDLFSQLTVHKSASASLEEGSLGATVDLVTGHPFDHSGFVFTTSAQYGYQAYAGSSNPRVAVLLSNTFMGGRLGFLVSAAYGSTNTLEEGSSTVRWMSEINTSTTGAASSSYRFGAVCTDAGATCYTTTSDDAFNEANAAFHPRFPRYEIYRTNSKRLGMTGSVQWQPDDNTLFTLDALYADFAQVRNEYQLEANSFSTSNYGSGGSFVNADDGLTYYYRSLGIRNISLINYASSNIGGSTGINSVGDDTYTLQRAEATGVGIRNEHRQDHLDTRFMQVTLDGTHSFSDALKVHALLGWTESHFRNPRQAYLMADYGCYGTTSVTNGIGCGAGTTTDPYVYDYSKSGMPLLSLGNVDPTSTSGWFLANIRMRENYVNNSFRSAAVDVEYKADDTLTLKAGASIRGYGYNTMEKRRGTDSSTSESSTLSADVRSVDLASYSNTVGFNSISTPSGSDTSWFALNFDKAASLLGLWDESVFPMSFAPGYSNTGAVHENDYAAWVEVDWDGEIANMPFRGNVGVRYVLTEMNSMGYTYDSALVALSPVEGHNVYHDVLPSMNVTLEPYQDLLVRFNASYAMTRPSLTSMRPTGSIAVTGSNATASIGNPTLKPTRSKNLDLSFEWYYAKGSMLSVAGFWKHIDTFTQSVQTTDVAANNPFGFDDAVFIAACGGTGSDWSTVTNSYCTSNGYADTPWTFTATVNAKGAPLYGTEINWQQQLDFLPAPFNNTGILANYTYVQAQQSYYNSNGSLIMTADLVNLSRNSYNATLYYDDKVFQARLTAAYRGKYLTSSNIASNNNNYGIYSEATLNVDASVSYKLDDNLLFTVDAINLTDQAIELIADKNAERSYVYHKTGRVFYLGVKYTY